MKYTVYTRRKTWQNTPEFPYYLPQLNHKSVSSAQALSWQIELVLPKHTSKVTRYGNMHIKTTDNSFGYQPGGVTGPETKLILEPAEVLFIGCSDVIRVYPLCYRGNWSSVLALL